MLIECVIHYLHKLCFWLNLSFISLPLFKTPTHALTHEQTWLLANKHAFIHTCMFVTNSWTQWLKSVSRQQSDSRQGWILAIILPLCCPLEITTSGITVLSHALPSTRTIGLLWSYFSYWAAVCVKGIVHPELKILSSFTHKLCLLKPVWMSKLLFAIKWNWMLIARFKLHSLKKSLYDFKRLEIKRTSYILFNDGFIVLSIMWNRRN